MNNFELIEKYLMKNMTEQELSLFELSLSSDEGLRKEVEEMRTLIIGIESKGLKAELDKYSILDINTSEVGKINKKFSLRPLVAAASIIGLLICGWLIYENNESSQEDLYASVFYKDPGLPTPMSETDHYTFYDAMVDYKYGNYKKALTKWNTLSVGIGKDTLDYYKAMAHLALKNYDESNVILQNLSKESLLFPSAKWYRIDIAIQQGNIEKAKKLLQSMKAHQHYDIEKANTILISLE